MEINLAEIEALRGMENLLSQDNIRLIAAGSYSLHRKQGCYYIEEILRDYGFSVHIGLKKMVYDIKEEITEEEEFYLSDHEIYEEEVEFDGQDFEIIGEKPEPKLKIETDIDLDDIGKMLE